jgi:hypothetical protein
MRVCQGCGGALPGGMGSNNAKLCLDCWADAIFQVETGARSRDVAREYGVSEIALYYKRRVYGQQREQGL